MTRVAFDSNVLLYAELEPESDKGARARDLLLRAFSSFSSGIVAVQAAAEFLSVARSRGIFDQAIAQAHQYARDFITPTTTDATLHAAASLSREHGFQLWDAIIIAASADAGATVLFSEDMQDGRHVAGLRILNPFNPANAAAVDALFPV